LVLQMLQERAVAVPMNLAPALTAFFLHLRGWYSGIDAEIVVGAFVNLQQVVFSINNRCSLPLGFVVNQQLLALHRPGKHEVTHAGNHAGVSAGRAAPLNNTVATLFDTKPAALEPFSNSFPGAIFFVGLGFCHFLFALFLDFDGRTTWALIFHSSSRIPNRAPAPAVFQPRTHNPWHKHQSHNARAALAILMTTHPHSPCAACAPLPIPVPALPETARALRNVDNLVPPYSRMRQARSAALPAGA